MKTLSIDPTPANAPVVVEGRFDVRMVPAVRGRLVELLDAGTVSLVVDLSEVDFMDSPALGLLVEVMKLTRSEGGDTKLIGPRNPDAARILRLTCLDRVFEILDQYVDYGQVDIPSV